MPPHQAAPIIQRIIHIAAPIKGEITVHLDIDFESACHRAAAQIADYAIRNVRGRTGSGAKIFISGTAFCSPELLAARDAYLRLANLTRHQLPDELKFG